MDDSPTSSEPKTKSGSNKMGVGGLDLIGFYGSKSSKRIGF